MMLILLLSIVLKWPLPHAQPVLPPCESIYLKNKTTTPEYFQYPSISSLLLFLRDVSTTDMDLLVPRSYFDVVVRKQLGFTFGRFTSCHQICFPLEVDPRFIR